MNVACKFPLTLALVLMGLISCEKTFSQEKQPLVHLARLVIDSARLEQYKAILKEEIEASVRTEPGVLTLYAVSEKDEPTHITIVEIYTDSGAYKAHLKTPHFIRYKTSTADMIKSLQLVEATPLIPDMKINVDSAALKQKKYQAKAPTTQPFGTEAFAASKTTTIRWLGFAGFHINSRGTNIMVDPVLQFDMPLIINFPIKAKDVPKLDAVLVTHSDNDHYSVPTVNDLKPVTKAFHSTVYVDSLMKSIALPSHGHKIGGKFSIGPIRVKLTPADHAWQNAFPGRSERTFKNEDCAGFWIETPDGNIWATGDTRLMPEHLTMPTPDAIFFDFSDDDWHFTFEGAVKLANAYPDTPLLLCHWGSVDAPDLVRFNGDPGKLYDRVVNPTRIIVLAPGHPYSLKRLTTSLKK